MKRERERRHGNQVWILMILTGWYVVERLHLRGYKTTKQRRLLWGLMFNHQYYRFAKWKRRLQELGITTLLISRYVDDSRAILQPIIPGWRWMDDDLRYAKRWEQEDKDIPGEIRTRNILVKTMTGLESYLAFPAET